MRLALTQDKVGRYYHGLPDKKEDINITYVITYENGVIRYFEGGSYIDALNYAESHNGGFDFTIEEECED